MRFSKNTLLAATTLALAFGCAPSNPGLVAEGVLSVDNMCLVSATNPYLAQGTLDVSQDFGAFRTTGTSYAVALRLGNQLLNNGNRIYPLMADPNRIVLNHFEVTLMNTSEAPLAIGASNPYLVPADGSIGSTQSMDPTFGIGYATIIPDAYGQLLAGQSPGTILVRVRAIGTTVGGATLTSNPLTFPVTLCTGCLFQAACDAMGNPVTAPSCAPGQDAITFVPGCGP
jgi:hypothetical protein